MIAFLICAATIPLSADVSHLEGKDGRIWLQLEWRALDKALRESGPARTAAVADVISFRTKRRQLIPSAMISENRVEMDEGILAYKALLLAMPSKGERRSAVLASLRSAPSRSSLAQAFALVSGPAYAVLLDESPLGWKKLLPAEDDFGLLLVRAYGLRTAPTPTVAAKAYDGQALMAQEAARTTP